MRISLASWKIQDWKGPATGVRLRIVANSTFLAREDDNTGVQVDSAPSVFREVDCTVANEIIEGLTVPVITVPALWLYSTNDALAPHRRSTYSAIFVTKSGREILRPTMLQSFQLLKELEDVFNPVPIHEVIRANNPAAPVPMDKDTFSKEQILELIGDGPTQIGQGNIAKRIAFWQTPIIIGGLTAFSDTVFEGQDGDPVLKLTRFPSSENIFVIKQDSAVGNPKGQGFGGALNLHLADANFQWHLLYSNDASNYIWVNNHFNDGKLEFRSYTDPADDARARIIFDEEGGIGVGNFALAGNARGWFFRDVDGIHLGNSNDGIDTSNRQITFLPTNVGVGINKQTGIGAQLHVESGLDTRIGLIVRNAQNSTVNIAEFRTHDSTQRFLFSHDAQLTIGQPGAIRGRVLFHAPSNANQIVLEPPNTPDAVVYRFPTLAPANGQLLRTVTFAAGLATLEWVNPTSGGDVSSDIGTVVDNTLTRFQGTTGKLITGSAIVVADTSGSFSVPNAWTVTSTGGSSVALNQFGSVFTAPSGSQLGFNIFEFIGGTQSQSSSEVHNHILRTTYNQTSTAGSDEIVMVRTETALGSGIHNFIRGIGGAAGNLLRFRIDNLGNYLVSSNGQFIGDSNAKQILAFFTAATPVNYLGLQNAGTGAAPAFSALGTDTNIPIALAPKGTGRVLIIGTGGLEINSTQPFLRITDTDAAKNWVMVTNGAGSLVIGEDAVSNAITIDHTTGLCSFEEIPVGPNATPTTDNQLARKKYVDDKAVFFAIPFKIDDPSTFVADNRGTLPSIRVPAMVSGGFITKIHVIYRTASHTSGGTITMTAEINTGSIGTVQINNTNSAANTWFTNDISDAAIVEGDTITAFLSRSGTITERDVTFLIEGFQKVKSL